MTENSWWLVAASKCQQLTASSYQLFSWVLVLLNLEAIITARSQRWGQIVDTASERADV